MATTSAPIHTQVTEGPGNAAHRPKILLVDDKPENLIALERLLMDLDVEVFKANSGNEALKAALHHDFALALLDIQMPGMDGYELAQILRGEERTAKLPFIFISAIYKDHINIFKGYEKGAFSYITKPFEPEILLNKVRFFIEKHQQEQALKDTHDILEKRVRARTAELERSNAELEQFAYVASHDLQEPLRMVTSYVQLLKRNYGDKLDGTANEFIDFSVDGATRMKQLIDDLLTYSRASRPEGPSEVDINRVVATVRKNLEASIRETDALITTDPLPTINAYRTGMTQLLQNLLSNAIKFRAADRRPIIHIAVEEHADHWVFAVQDNGIGIEQQYAEKVFVIFKRLHSRAEYPGTGIGLAVARKIVHRLGGRVWFSSEVGKGTTFYFTVLKHLP
jgi:two-component system, sensor histidine kinase and response regulator